MSRIVALFKSHEEADAAVDELIGMGVSKNEISILMGEEAESSFSSVPRSEQYQKVNIEKNDRSAEGAAVGSAVGGLLGAIAAAGVISVGTVATSGVGIVAAGPIVAALAGAGAGGTAGGAVGFIAGMGVEKHEAEVFADRISNGSILVAVDSERDSGLIKKVIHKHDGHTSKSV